MRLRVRRDHVPYDVWATEGCLETTEGNVIHYGFIENFIEELGTKYHIKEIAFDRWGATQMVQDLEGMGFNVVPFRQGNSCFLRKNLPGRWRGLKEHCCVYVLE